VGPMAHAVKNRRRGTQKSGPIDKVPHDREFNRDGRSVMVVGREEGRTPGTEAVPRTRSIDNRTAPQSTGQFRQGHTEVPWDAAGQHLHSATATIQFRGVRQVRQDGDGVRQWGDRGQAGRVHTRTVHRPGRMPRAGTSTLPIRQIAGTQVFRDGGGNNQNVRSRIDVSDSPDAHPWMGKSVDSDGRGPSKERAAAVGRICITDRAQAVFVQHGWPLPGDA